MQGFEKKTSHFVGRLMLHALQINFLVTCLVLIRCQFDPIPSPTPTPTNQGFGAQQNRDDIIPLNLQTHTTLAPFDFSFSYQPCSCVNGSDPSCADANRTDPLYPSFQNPGCVVYTRMGAAFNLFPITSALHHGTHHGGTSGIGDGDLLWEYPEINYLAESRVRYTDYTQKYPDYVSKSTPIPPMALDDSAGAQVITNTPALIQIVSEKPLIRWKTNPHTFEVPWSYVLKIYSKINNSSPHIFQSPSPSPSPTPVPSPSPVPHPSPSPVPSALPPTPISEPDFTFDTVPVPPPILPEYEWQLKRISSNRLSRDFGLSPQSSDEYVAQGLMEETKVEVCRPDIAQGTALGNAIKTTVNPSSKQWSLRCQKRQPNSNNQATNATNEDPEVPRIIVEVETVSAACRVNYIQGDSSVVAKAVVLGDFGEPASPNPASAWTSGVDPAAPFSTGTETRKRRIVIPNLFASTPFTYDPSLNRTNPAEDFSFPVEELNDPNVYTEHGYDPATGDPLPWRVVLANLLPEPPQEVLDLMYPQIGNGAIVSCDLPQELPPGSSPESFNLFQGFLHTSNDGRTVWFFVPGDVTEWYLGTHSGSETAGTSSQLGISPLHILHNLQRRLEDGYDSIGENGAIEYLPDFCGGADAQFAIDAEDALTGLEEGRYDGSRPFLFSHNFSEWVSIHHIPSVPGVCGLAEMVLHEFRVGHALNSTFFGSDLYQHQMGTRYLSDSILSLHLAQDVWAGEISNPSRPWGYERFDVSSRVLGDAERPLFYEQNKDWFIDGVYLYHRVTENDVSAVLDRLENRAIYNNVLGRGFRNFFLNFEQNLVSNLLIDISDMLLNYVGSTTYAYFQKTPSCYWYIDSFAINDTISGYISNTICAPSFIDPNSDLVESQDGQTVVVYDLQYQCDAPIEFEDGDLQQTPPVIPGQCVQYNSPYSFPYDPNEVQPPPTNDPNYVFSVNCTTLLISGLSDPNVTHPVVYDQAISRCAATYDVMCTALGLCPDDEGFFGRHKVFVYFTFSIVGVMLISLIIYVSTKIAKKRKGNKLREQEQKTSLENN